MSLKQSTLGGRIARARADLGLSPEELAMRIGVKATTVAKWERGQSEPRSNRLMTLAGILNVPMAWLMAGEGTEAAPCQPEPADGTDAITSKLQRALALQQDLAALLNEVSADVARLQREIDKDELAA